MAAEIRVPEMGESIVEATVGRWFKGPGDPVYSGEPVLELETEKVNLEVPAPQDGVLGEVRRREGETVKVGEVLGTITEKETARPAPEAAEDHRAERRPEHRETQPAPAERELARERMEEAPPRVEAKTAAGDRATPVARQMAQRLSIDLSQVKGTGPGGRVTQEDVERHVSERIGAPPRREAVPQEAPERAIPQESPAVDGAARQEAASRPETVPSPPPAAPAAPAPGRYEERVRLSRRRQTIARRLTEAHQTAVMTTTFNEIDLGSVVELRGRHRSAFRERHEVDLGFMSFFVKAVVATLKIYPQLNAELEGDELVYKYYYDIGIAVSDEEGLVVPVLRDADKKGFAEIERDIADLARRTRERRLTLEELSGGTFTITNGGVFGSLLSTPVLNPPQVGILGMHRIMERPAVVAGEVVVRPMMYVALTYDHRVVDGREAVLFLGHIKGLLEDPSRMLLES